MENASKALLMGAGILIGVMLLSFLVMVFYIFGDFAKEQQAQISDKTTKQFNMQFLVFEGENKNAHDIVNVINLVKDIRESDNSQSQGYNDNIKVTVKGHSDINQTTSEDKLLQFLQESYDSTGQAVTTYTCTVEYNDEGRVDLIKFTN